jgi:hypothetical protein
MRSRALTSPFGGAPRYQDAARSEAAQRLTGHGTAYGIDGDIDALAGRDSANAIGKTLG